MKVHPVFIIGIILMLLPTLTPIIGITLWSWISKLGFFTVLVGVGLTAFGGE